MINVKQGFVDRFHCTLVESTLPYFNLSKLAKYVESKLSMWQDITNLNMTTQVVEQSRNHPNWCQRDQMNCSRAYYGHMGHWGLKKVGLHLRIFLTTIRLIMNTFGRTYVFSYEVNTRALPLPTTKLIEGLILG